MIKNYIFTVTVGRSGQATLYDIVKKYSNNCIAALEEPNINYYSTGYLRTIERLIRRKYFETDELLGRGRILDAFVNRNDDYIKEISKKRLIIAKDKAKKSNANIYFDISKFYARGLHIGFNNILSDFTLIFLYRDPLLNMKSFINRNKNFLMDNNCPDEERNVLTMSSKGWSQGEFYLWSWSEIYLRFKKILSSNKVKKSLIVSSSDLMNPKKVSKILDKLEIKHSKILSIKKMNTNVEVGIQETKIEKKDIEILEKFISRLSKEIFQELFYLKDSLEFHTKNFREK